MISRRIRDDVSFGQVAQQFFSQNEISSLEKIDINKRPELFFQYWTRKEAFLKARGEGISFPMEQCDVSLISGSGLSPVKFLADGTNNQNWHVQDLFPGDGYVAAIAVEGADWNISYTDYGLINREPPCEPFVFTIHKSNFQLNQGKAQMLNNRQLNSL